MCKIPGRSPKKIGVYGVFRGTPGRHGLLCAEGGLRGNGRKTGTLRNRCAGRSSLRAAGSRKRRNAGNGYGTGQLWVRCGIVAGTEIFAKNGGYLLSVNIKNFRLTIAIIRPIRYNRTDNRVVMRIARKRANKRNVVGLSVFDSPSLNTSLTDIIRTRF